MGLSCAWLLARPWSGASRRVLTLPGFYGVGGPKGFGERMSVVGPSRPNFSLGPDVSFRGEVDVDRAAESAASVESDPTATLAAHCNNGFDAGFNPVQSIRLSR
jgi:hypothetical protein